MHWKKGQIIALYILILRVLESRLDDNSYGNDDSNYFLCLFCSNFIMNLTSIFFILSDTEVEILSNDLLGLNIAIDDAVAEPGFM